MQTRSTVQQGEPYAPSSVLSDRGIGASGGDYIETLGDTTLGNAASDAISIVGTADFVESPTFSSGFVSLDTSSFNGDVNLGNAVGDAISVLGTATFNEDATFVKNCNFFTAGFSGAVTLGNAPADNIISVGTFFANNASFFAGPARFDDPLFFSGNGRIRYRTSVIAAD